MTAWYNENDPKAAAWLRELIVQGHVAPGVVDERDIRDVRPSDLDGFDQCHFFAGIGVWSYALRRAGWSDERPVWTGSCPCQPFSAAGKGAGVDDERHLWPAWFWLISERRPAVVFGEQVEAAIRHAWLDLVQTDLEGCGYAVAPMGLPAAGFGAPHIRQRLYFVANAGGERVRADGSGSTAAAAAGVQGPHGQRERLWLDAGEHGAPGGAGARFVAESESERHERAGAAWGRGDGPTDSSGTSGLANNNGRREQRNAQLLDGQRAPQWHDADGCSAALLVGDLDDARPQGRRVPSATGSGDGAGERAARPTGPVNGHWSAAEWLPCTDGKARPVEPGTSPLAHGAPARVGRLRGYGNAIVAPVAEEFIRAYMTRELDPQP